MEEKNIQTNNNNKQKTPDNPAYTKSVTALRMMTLNTILMKREPIRHRLSPCLQNPVPRSSFPTEPIRHRISPCLRNPVSRSSLPSEPIRHRISPVYETQFHDPVFLLNQSDIESQRSKKPFSTIQFSYQTNQISNLTVSTKPSSTIQFTNQTSQISNLTRNSFQFCHENAYRSV